MILTREQAIELHRDMWNWMADQIICAKEPRHIYFLKKEYVDKHNFCNVCNNCFLCEYAGREGIANECIGDFCEYCPIEWGEENNHRCADNSLGLYAQAAHYNYYRDEYMKQAEQCRQIANLPERMW